MRPRCSMPFALAQPLYTTRCTNSSPGVLAISTTWGQTRGNGCRIARSREHALWKDCADGRKCGGAGIIVEDTIPTVHYPLIDILVNDVEVFDIGPPESDCHLCMSSLGWNLQIDHHILALWTSFFSTVSFASFL